MNHSRILSCLVPCALLLGQGAPSTGTTTFILDGNRIYAELGFVRPNGSIHRALAFVDMGSPTMSLRASLYKELQLDSGRSLTFQVGKLVVDVPATEVVSEPGEPYAMRPDLSVEALLPAGILQRHVVAFDYQHRLMTLTDARGAPPPLASREPQALTDARGALPPLASRSPSLALEPQALTDRVRDRTPGGLGVIVPFRINAKTGLISVDASIDGKPYSITIDNGSAYTWFRQDAAKSWLVSHPGWKRGVGAVGASDMMMSGDGTETAGTLMRIPEISLGSLVLRDAGALAVGPGRPISQDLDLFDWYSLKNAGAVAGWIGGNVLKSFKLTIDYPNRRMYWAKQRELDSHDLDQVGLTLRAEGRTFFVAAIATKNGKPTVEGVLPGDKLLQIGGLDTRTATWGGIYDAMHGRPGETRSIILERNGRRLTVTAPVTAF